MCVRGQLQLAPALLDVDLGGHHGMEDRCRTGGEAPAPVAGQLRIFLLGIEEAKQDLHFTANELT
jgi:hypothetical protein